MLSTISSIEARQILDSRGNPTLEVEVELKSGDVGVASVPSGASTGKFEAVELRDNEPAFDGKGVRVAVDNVNTVIANELLNMDAASQYEIDQRLLELDGTKNKGNIGANAILGVSMACARACSNYYKIPLYKYLGGIFGGVLPVPMMNIINGGEHANNNLDFQEFMIAPVGAESFSEAMEMGMEIFYTLKKLLNKKGLSTSVGDEGGFAPDLGTNFDAIELLIDAIQKADYTTEQVKICLDVASSEFYSGGKYFVKSNYYTSLEFSEVLENIVSQYPVISIEDGMAQDDWEGWRILSQKLGKKCQLVGDDLFVTNLERIRQGIEESVANAVLIKLNQIGTLTETLNAINYAKNYGYTTIISHRSGETEDTFIADLSVGVNSGQIKTGSLSRGERVVKYNRLLKIEQELGASAKYFGINAFNPRIL